MIAVMGWRWLKINRTTAGGDDKVEKVQCRHARALAAGEQFRLAGMDAGDGLASSLEGFIAFREGAFDNAESYGTAVHALVTR